MMLDPTLRATHVQGTRCPFGSSRKVTTIGVVAAISLGACAQSTTSVLPEDETGPSLANAVIRVVSGNDQEGEVDGFLNLPLTVEVVDSSGAPIEGAAVVWEFAQGTGRIDSGAAAGTLADATDTSGRASAAWRLGTVAGTQAASAALVLPVGQPERVVALTALGQPGPPSGIALIPDAVTLAIGDSTQFVLEVTDVFGNAIHNPSLAWSSRDEGVAEVRGSGVVFGLGEGATFVQVTAESVQDSAAVTVVSVVTNQPPTASVTSPAQNVTIEVDESVDFQGSASDSDGTVETHLWDFDDGSTATVEDPGAHTFTQSGTYVVTYRVWDDEGAGSPTVTRTISVEEPNPGPSPEILFEDGFESPDFTAQGWYDLGPWVQSTTESHSGNGSLEFHFNAGSVDPIGGYGRHLFDETPTLYLSYWVKYSANWLGSGLSYNPHEFLVLTNEDGQYTGPAWTALTLYVEHVHQSGGNVPVVMASDRRNIDQGAINQDLTNITENRAANGCNGSADGYPGSCWNAGANYWNEKAFSASQPYFTDNPGPGYKNDWHHVEVYVELNSIQGGIGQNDGVIRYWFDGALALDYDDVLLRTGAHPDMAFNQLIIGPYMESGSPQAQTFWIDDVRIGTARPPGP